MTVPTAGEYLNSPSHSALHRALAGGTAGQVYTKVSGTDYDAGYADPVGPVLDRMGAQSDSSILLTGAGGDIDWTGATVTENIGTSFDLNGTSANDGVPTLRVLHDGVYSINVLFEVVDPQDATNLAQTLTCPDPAGAFSPTNGYSLGGANPVIYVATFSMTYTYPADGAFTFSVNANAGSDISVGALFDIQRLA